MTGFNCSDVSEHVEYLRKENKELKDKIEEANKIINVYCVGCFHFENNDCDLKLPKNCPIKALRVCLSQGEMKK